LCKYSLGRFLNPIIAPSSPPIMAAFVSVSPPFYIILAK